VPGWFGVLRLAALQMMSGASFAVTVVAADDKTIERNSNLGESRGERNNMGGSRFLRVTDQEKGRIVRAGDWE
jgi:hypothetical protein